MATLSHSQKEWPDMNEREMLRIFHINHNGITYNNDYLEWEMTLAYLMDMQVDIFGITEAKTFLFFFSFRWNPKTSFISL